MDDVLLPLALAFATAVLMLTVHGIVTTAARHRYLRARDGWREGEAAVRE